MKSWTFILFYLFIYEKFTVKLIVKNKTSKKFKKGISFVFTLVDQSIFTALPIIISRLFKSWQKQP